MGSDRTLHRETLDRYARLESPIHRLPAGVKLGTASGVVVGTLLLPRYAWWWYGIEAALLLSLVALSRLPWRFFLGKLLRAEPVLMAVALLSLWQPDGHRVFLALVCRSTLCVTSMMLGLATTPFADVLHVLQRLRVPRMLVTTLALTFRYHYLLQEEASRMRRARQARTFQARRRVAWQGLSTVVAQLFLRAMARAERLHAAMLSRGWRP